MIVTFTPNPALDRTLISPGFRNSDVTRVQAKHDGAGGKGLNVARALHRLGVQYQAIAPLGGTTGAAVVAAARAEGIAVTVIPISGETRTCVSLTDPNAPDQLVINEPGPDMSGAEWESICATIIAQCAHADWLTISGSIPPGVTPHDLRALVTRIPVGCRVAIDTSGAPLHAVLDAPIALLKINRDELTQALGSVLLDNAAIITAAQTLVARGPRTVVVTLGAAGALAIDADTAWHISAPDIVALSPVGSGDCLLAGMVAALNTGMSFPDAVAAGVAAGSANALMPYAGVFDMTAYTLFRQQAQITPIG